MLGLVSDTVFVLAKYKMAQTGGAGRTRAFTGNLSRYFLEDRPSEIKVHEIDLDFTQNGNNLTKLNSKYCCMTNVFN